MRRRQHLRPNPLNLQSQRITVPPDKWVRLESPNVLVECPHCSEHQRCSVLECQVNAVCDDCKLPFSLFLDGYGYSPPRPRREKHYGPHDDTH
jgi:hypothetical protein